MKEIWSSWVSWGFIFTFSWDALENIFTLIMRFTEFESNILIYKDFRKINQNYNNYFLLLKIWIYIYLLHYNLNPDTAGSASINAKEIEKERKVRRVKKRKWIEAQRAKPSTPSQAINAHIGNEKQNGNPKKKQGASPQSSYPGPFGRLLRPTSYGGPIKIWI